MKIVHSLLEKTKLGNLLVNVTLTKMMMENKNTRKYLVIMANYSNITLKMTNAQL